MMRYSVQSRYRIFVKGAIHKGCPHIRGEGVQTKVDKYGQGEGEWLA